MDNRKIIRNMAQCLKCGDVIESTHVHDFRYCKCKSIAVDGGKEYIRRAFRSLDALKELTIYEDDNNIII